MEEEQTTLAPEEQIKQEKQHSEDMISMANAAAARLEAANRETARLIAIAERQRVEKTMGGKSETRVEQKEESPVDYMKKVMGNEIETTD